MKAALLKAFGVLLLLSAIALALSRAPDRPVETLVARWAPPPSDFVDVDGLLVHLRDEGPRDDAAPIVLLHDVMSSLHAWEGWATALRPQRRVITLDLPGCGLSGAQPEDDYSADADVRFVLRLLERLRVGRFVIGGNGAGGGVAWRLALQVPQRVERLILVDAAGQAVEPTALPLLWRIDGLPPLARITEDVLPRPLLAQALVDLYGHADRVSAERVDRAFELTLRAGNRRALALRLAQADRGADATRIAGLTLPTLILWGGRDRITPPAAAARFQAAIAGSRLQIFDDLGHSPQEEDAGRTVAALRGFILRP